jgi:hypothetical protein
MLIPTAVFRATEFSEQSSEETTSSFPSECPSLQYSLTYNIVAIILGQLLLFAECFALYESYII